MNKEKESKKKKNGCSNKPRHAFLILAHEKPHQLSDLIDALHYPYFDLYLHVDVRARGDFSEIEKTREMISKYDISWGGFSMVEATLLLLKRAAKKVNYHSYTLLSGKDYPIKSNKYIYKKLSSITSTRIVHWHDKKMSRRKRYCRHYFHDLPYPASKVLNKVSDLVGDFLPDRSLPEGVVPYFGSQWWTLNQYGANAILRFIDRRPDVVRFMRTVHIPDEMFFQTALVNTQHKLKLISRPLRYFDWSEGRAHPKIIKKEDLGILRNSKCLFARKFDKKETPNILKSVEKIRQTSQ